MVKEMLVIPYICIFLIFFILRFPLLFIGRRTLNHDSYLYLLLSKHFGKKKKILYDQPTLIPPLPPLIFSITPKRFIPYIPFIIESVNVITLIIFLNLFGLEPFQITMVCSLFISYPLFTSIYSGPRTYKPTPRLFSEIYFNLMMIFLFLFISKGGIHHYSLSLLFAVSLLLNNRFGIQILILLLFPLGIITGSIPTIILISGAFILSTLLYREFPTILIAHIYFLKNYALDGQFHHPLIQARKRFKILVLKREGIKKFMASLLMESDWFNFFVKNYLAIALIIILFSKGNEMPIFILYWFILSIVLFLLTTFKYLRFLGEAERYLFYGAIPLFILLSQYEFSDIIILSTLCVHIIYWIVMGIAIYLRENDSDVLKREKNIAEISTFIKKNKIDNIIPLDATFPWEIIYLSDKKYCGFFSRKKQEPQFYETMRLPIKDLSKLRRNYQFEAILLNNQFFDRYKEGLSGFKKIYTNKHYSLYKSKNGRKG